VHIEKAWERAGERSDREVALKVVVGDSNME
jgi:hypothetical protein